MRLLVISNMFPSPAVPNSGIFVLRQLQALKRQGMEIEVLSPVPYAPPLISSLRQSWRKYRTLPRRAVHEGISVSYVRYLRLPGTWFMPYESLAASLAFQWWVRKKYRKGSYDAVLANMILPDGYLAEQVGRSLGIPSFCYIVGADINTYPDWDVRISRQTRRTIERLDFVLSVGDGLAQQTFERYLNLNKKIDVIPRGCDLTRFKQGRRERRAGDPLVALYVGALIPAKGISELLACMNQLVREEVVFRIAGDGELRTAVESEASKFKDRLRVEFLGKVSHDRMPELLQDADVFVFPSYTEGLPNVLIEAAACGIPIVATDIPGNQDVVKQGLNGLLVPVGDSRALADAVRVLLKNSDLRTSLGMQGRRIVEEYFDAEVNAVKLKHFIENGVTELKPKKASRCDPFFPPR